MEWTKKFSVFAKSLTAMHKSNVKISTDQDELVRAMILATHVTGENFALQWPSKMDRNRALALFVSSQLNQDNMHIQWLSFSQRNVELAQDCLWSQLPSDVRERIQKTRIKWQVKDSLCTITFDTLEKWYDKVRPLVSLRQKL